VAHAGVRKTDIPCGSWPHLLVVLPVDGRYDICVLRVELPIRQGSRRALCHLRRARATVVIRLSGGTRWILTPSAGRSSVSLVVMGDGVTVLIRIQRQGLGSGPPLSGEQPVREVVGRGVFVVDIVVQGDDNLGGGDEGGRRLVGGNAVAPVQERRPDVPRAVLHIPQREMVVHAVLK